MGRRTFLTASAALLAAPLVHAQTPRVARVAWVSVAKEDLNSPFLRSFRDAMRATGWIEGRNLALSLWWGGGSTAGLRQRVPEILAGSPEVIVTAGGPATRVLADANVEPPLAFTVSADVVLSKLVNDWGRPGVNRTGISFFALDLIPKRVQLIREIMPAARRLAIVGWPPHAGELLELEAATKAAGPLNFETRYFGANDATELEGALDSVAQWKGEALLVFAGALTALAPRFAAFSMRQRVPAFSSWAEFAEQGNVLTHGPILAECHARLAYFVDRILRGAKASELPVERPTKFELVINLKTANAIGLRIPQSVLLQADRVIDA